MLRGRGRQAGKTSFVLRWIEKCGFYICWVVRTVGVISVRTIHRNKLNCFSRVASAFSPKKNDRIFRLSWSDGGMFRPGTFRLLAVGCSQRTVPSARATCPTYSLFPGPGRWLSRDLESGRWTPGTVASNHGTDDKSSKDSWYSSRRAVGR